ncbi:FAD assembly factor SdhE [Indioceanicola profundi]|uniref:FAD assembly factor SdhE n=1 Tax=Indioceanicola profundi TaxID=2220096 RepID=UPI0013C49B34|nr:succinate dehydrogenase assembly factor 2 [Indioceanicola profundi]
MTADPETVLDPRRKRLIFRSWHRGTKEMDLLMGSFADRHMAGFTDEQVARYESLLELSDPDLYNWITGAEQAPEDVRSDVFDLLAAHRYAG